jgi:branched-subunit amino acid ABC-type transport system permease component
MIGGGKGVKMEKRRSKGVTIFGVIYLLGSIFNSIALFGSICSYYWFKNAQNLPFAFNLPWWYPIFAFVLLIIMIGGIIVSIGVLKLLPWARILIIILATFGLLAGFINKPSMSFRQVATVEIQPDEEASRIKAKLGKQMEKIPPMSEAITLNINTAITTANIFLIIIYFSFLGGSIYFFTRPKVREQFK